MRYTANTGRVQAMLAALLWLCVTAAWADNLPDFTGLVAQCTPAVVNISTTQKVKAGGMPPGMPDLPEGSPFGDLFKHFFGDQEGGAPREYDAKSLGSGFIISPDGYILTNYHVVNNAEEILVRLSDRRQLKAKVVGADERSDIALLKIAATDLPVVKIGKSSNLKVGAWVLAIGSPFGFDHSATAGIVSAKGRSLPSENYVPFIQTDVAINPGNSGGPLFNLQGEVVGINSQIYSRTGGYMGLSFSIPIEVAMDVADQLRTKGKVTRGWLGVLIQDVTRDLAESFGMDKPEGALVAKVMPGSPAAKAGIAVGDVITKFNGRDVITSASLPPIVGSAKVGEKVPVTVMRGGKPHQLYVVLGALPDKETASGTTQEQAPPSSNRLGMVVADLTPDQRTELHLDKPAVMVTQVDPESAASRAGIQKGDIVLTVNGSSMKTASQFESLVKGLAPGASVPVLLQRRGGPLFVAVKVPGKG